MMKFKFSITNFYFDVSFKRLIKKIGVAPTDIAEKIKENLKVLLDLE